MQIKAVELSDEALDWAVATIEKVNIDKWGEGWVKDPAQPHFNKPFKPSSDPSQGHAILEREKIELEPIWNVVGCGVRTSFKEWRAMHPKNHGGLNRYGASGPTMLIAGLRCHVAANLGQIVEVPDELFE